MSFKDEKIELSYKSIGDNNILNDFLLPLMNHTVSYKRSVGFFSSSVFELIKNGVNSIRNNNGTIKIICSPELSQKDVIAINYGYKLRDEFLDEYVKKNIEAIVNELGDESLKLLIDLIENNILEIKVVDTINEQLGMYHDKIGILEDKEGNKVLFVGSPNESKTAYQLNYEKIRVSKSWEDENRVLDDESEFDSLWNGINPNIRYKSIDQLVAKEVKTIYENKIREKHNNISEPIELRDYQKKAIEKWINNNKKGFFVMATGTGKTWTAIYSAKQITDSEKIILVIIAPYKHLIKQWADDLVKIYPNNRIILASSENPKWEIEIKDAILDSEYNEPKTIIIASTIPTFKSDRFDKALKISNLHRMLIADEAHRFKYGDIAGIIERKYKYLIGLSATPINRSTDDFGKQLIDFFGGCVFNLPIEEAIRRRCLVEYNYHPIFVRATIEEEEKFQIYARKMAEELKAKHPNMDKVGEYKRNQLRIISMAKEKTSNIDAIIDKICDKDHFIVYCGDGQVIFDNNDSIKHLDYVKDILDKKGFKTSKFTANESMVDRANIVNMFEKGIIDDIVAIRCLDEGINIPSIKSALILSSNDSYREFVQRRGRILRKFTNKYNMEEKGIANIYDVVVLPSIGVRNLAKIELRRFCEYAKLAKNAKENIILLEKYMEDYAIKYEDFDLTFEIERSIDE